MQLLAPQRSQHPDVPFVGVREDTCYGSPRPTTAELGPVRNSDIIARGLGGWIGGQKGPKGQSRADGQSHNGSQGRHEDRHVNLRVVRTSDQGSEKLEDVKRVVPVWAPHIGCQKASDPPGTSAPSARRDAEVLDAVDLERDGKAQDRAPQPALPETLARLDIVGLDPPVIVPDEGHAACGREYAREEWGTLFDAPDLFKRPYVVCREFFRSVLPCLAWGTTFGPLPTPRGPDPGSSLGPTSPCNSDSAER